jgi:hypothetical protein
MRADQNQPPAPEVDDEPTLPSRRVEDLGPELEAVRARISAVSLVPPADLTPAAPRQVTLGFLLRGWIASKLHAYARWIDRLATRISPAVG